MQVSASVRISNPRVGRVILHHSVVGMTLDKAFWWDFPRRTFAPAQPGLSQMNTDVPAGPPHVQNLSWSAVTWTWGKYGAPLLHPADAATPPHPRPWRVKQVHKSQTLTPALSENVPFFPSHWVIHVITAGPLCLCEEERTPLPLAGRSPLQTQGWGWSAAWGSTPRSVSWTLCAGGSRSVLASPPLCSRTKRLYQTHQPPPPPPPLERWWEFRVCPTRCFAEIFWLMRKIWTNYSGNVTRPEVILNA